MTPARRLSLGILDAEDLAVVSACLQDAVVKASDMAFISKAGRFALVANRFAWEGDPRHPARVRAGVHFDKVRAVRSRGLDPQAVEQVLELLTVETRESETGVVIDLVFAGDAVVRLEAEVIDGGLKDLSDPWPTKHRPLHRTDEG